MTRVGDFAAVAGFVPTRLIRKAINTAVSLSQGHERTQPGRVLGRGARLGRRLDHTSVAGLLQGQIGLREERALDRRPNRPAQSRVASPGGGRLMSASLSLVRCAGTAKPRVLGCPGARRGSRRAQVTSPPRRRFPPMPAARPGWWPGRRACSPGCPPSSSFPESLSFIPAGSRTWPTAIASRVEASIGQLAGPMRSLLAMERTALNFLQRLSGIATLTARYVAAVARHARGDLRHAQDHARLAFSREVRRPVRRRCQSPIRPLRRGPDQGQSPRLDQGSRRPGRP